MRVRGTEVSGCEKEAFDQFAIPRPIFESGAARVMSFCCE